MALHKVTPPQIRAARAMLDWSLLDLSRAARVSVSVVKRVQDGEADPDTETGFAAIQDALETEGVRFLDDDGHGVGVRLKVK